MNLQKINLQNLILEDFNSIKTGCNLSIKYKKIYM